MLTITVLESFKFLRIRHHSVTGFVYRNSIRAWVLLCLFFFKFSQSDSIRTIKRPRFYASTTSLCALKANRKIPSGTPTHSTASALLMFQSLSVFSNVVASSTGRRGGFNDIINQIMGCALRSCFGSCNVVRFAPPYKRT